MIRSCLISFLCVSLNVLYVKPSIRCTVLIWLYCINKMLKSITKSWDLVERNMFLHKTRCFLVLFSFVLSCQPTSSFLDLWIICLGLLNAYSVLSIQLHTLIICLKKGAPLKKKTPQFIDAWVETEAEPPSATLEDNLVIFNKRITGASHEGAGEAGSWLGVSLLWPVDPEDAEGRWCQSLHQGMY